jgi:hypothetical protein
VRWRRIAQTVFLGLILFYVFGYLYWQFWAFIFSPAAAWVITVLVCMGLPAAFVWGQLRRKPCYRCQERERTVYLLEDRMVELLRERDRLRAQIHDSLFSPAQPQQTAKRVGGHHE